MSGQPTNAEPGTLSVSQSSTWISENPLLVGCNFPLEMIANAAVGGNVLLRG